MEIRLLELLDMDYPGLKQVKEAADQRDMNLVYAGLKQHWMERALPKMFTQRDELEELSDYVRKYCPAELREVMRTADEVVEGTFLFRFPWDMERTRVPVTFHGAIDWNHVPDRDVEWAYMLNRHRYWGALGQAYVLTGEERYAAVCCKQLEDWIDRNPLPAEKAAETLTWRTIDAGLRCVNWIKAIAYLLRSPSMTPNLIAKILVSLYEHAEYLTSSFNGWKKISNWGVLETCGLFTAAVFMPEFHRSASWKQLSIQRLGETARLQVMQDGMHWEQSPTYHHEVLNCYLDILLLARNQAIPIEEPVREVIRKMAYASLLGVKPNHKQVMRGDSDDSDIRSVLTGAAVLLGDKELRFGGYERMDYDNAWSFGLQGIKMYSDMQGAAPECLSHAFEHAGDYVMRSGWDEQALYLNFHCGPLGGGHGHSDLLHLDIHAYGRDFLTDLGRYNYSDHTALRQELKRGRSHNTTQVDGIEFTEITGTWGFGRVANPTGVRWIARPDIDYVEGSHDGYMHLDDPVRPVRRILFIKPNFWFLVDSFTGRQTHTYTQTFHFAPGKVNLCGHTGLCQTGNRSAANFAIIPVEPAELRSTLHEGIISYEYNLAEPHSYVTYERSGTGVVSMMQILYPQRSGEYKLPAVAKIPVYRYTGELASDRDVVACRVRQPGSAETQVIVICHRPPAGPRDSYVVEGIQIFGEVVVITQLGNEHVVKVVK